MTQLIYVVSAQFEDLESGWSIGHAIGSFTTREAAERAAEKVEAIFNVDESYPNFSADVFVPNLREAFEEYLSSENPMPFDGCCITELALDSMDSIFSAR